MALRLKSILFSLAVSAVGLLSAQTTITIKDVKKVASGETLTIPAGSTVEFGPGAVLQVEGGLVIEGNESSPVIFKNSNNATPGLGILINSANESASIKIKGAKFENLVQPLRFDPFWHRKSVGIEAVSISGSKTGEPVIYMAMPLTDLRAGHQIQFSMEKMTFSNNAGGVLLESVGSDGLKLKVDQLTFNDNNIIGSDNSLGIFHLDISNLYKSSNVTIGSLKFIRNYAGTSPIGISVSGLPSHTLIIDNLAQGDLTEDVVFDRHNDPRIPTIEVKNKVQLTKELGFEGILNINHTYGTVTMLVAGNPEVISMNDSQGHKVDYTFTKRSDTLQFKYIQGYPAKAILKNGTTVSIPQILAGGVPNLEITNIDTAEYNKYLREKAKTNGQGVEQSDVIGIGLNLNLPTFKKKGEVVRKLRVWEIGAWGGGAIYGGGDIHHKRVMDFKSAPSFVKNAWLIKGFPIFSTVEYSFGGYGQYNLNSRFSLKASGYVSTISMHNLFAPGLFAAGRNENTVDTGYNPINPGSTWNNMFITKMQIFELEGLWHLTPYKIADGKKGKLVHSLGLSLGILHFTPYRIAYTNQHSNETRDAYINRMYSEHLYNLRLVGSEGQNFIPGMKPYSSITTSIGSSYSITYLRKRFALKAEMKFVYTATDYLDDFGPGLWYGGDIKKLRASIQYENLPEAEITKITAYNPAIAKNAPRSTNGLNDWYYQMHLGMSYILFK